MADYCFLWFLNSSELCFFFFFFGFSIPFKVFEEKLEPNEECDISNMLFVMAWFIWIEECDSKKHLLDSKFTSQLQAELVPRVFSSYSIT